MRVCEAPNVVKYEHDAAFGALDLVPDLRINVGPDRSPQTLSAYRRSMTTILRNPRRWHSGGREVLYTNNAATRN
jgi:hypothetical protein